MSNPEDLLTKIPRELLKRKKAQDKYFELTRVSSSKLKPVDILDGRGKKERGFREEYYPRETIDNEIKKRIDANDNLIIIGPPLSGKTRSVYEALKSLKEPRNVLTPRLIDVDPNDLLIPIPAAFFRNRIVLIDDLDKYIVKNNFIYLLDEIHRKHLKKRDFLIIATCRTGEELKIVQDSLDTRFFDMFGDPIKIPKVDDDEGEKVAKKYHIDFVKKQFDGNIGTLFIPLGEMKRRFSSLGEIEQGILRSLKRLYYAGIYESRETFSVKHLEKVCNVSRRIDLTPDQWETHLKLLSDNAFIEWNNKGIRGEEAYFYDVIEDNFTLLDNFLNMLSIFSGDPEALYLLGNRANDIAEVSIERANLERIAIVAFVGTLGSWTYEANPRNYAKSQNCLGSAYRTLAEVENWGENCRKAIGAYEEALKVSTLDRFPMDYAMANNNLGKAYVTLADVEERAENCKRAIAVFGEALKVFTLDSFPVQNAMTNNNLGNAYRILASVEDRAMNSKKAIGAFKEALKVYTMDGFPSDYAMCMNNLGYAYRVLSEEEDRTSSIRSAIAAYEEALRIYSLDRFPLQYATVQNNLGNALGVVSEEEDIGSSSKRAIKAFKNALKINTFERFPFQYAMTQNNLGIVYGILSRVENTVENARKAISAFNEALKIRNREDFPLQFALTMNNIANTYVFLSNVENKEENLDNAIEAYKEALSVLTMELSPIESAETENNLGNAYYMLSRLKDEKTNIENAISAYKRSINIFSKDKYEHKNLMIRKKIDELRRLNDGGGKR